MAVSTDTTRTPVHNPRRDRACAFIADRAHFDAIWRKTGNAPADRAAALPDLYWKAFLNEFATLKRNREFAARAAAALPAGTVMPPRRPALRTRFTGRMAASFAN